MGDMVDMDTPLDTMDMVDMATPTVMVATTTWARGLLMPSQRQMLLTLATMAMLMDMVSMDMVDMDTPLDTMDMVDMDTPTVMVDTTIRARGLLMPSQRQMPTTDPWDTMVMDTAMDTMDMDTDMDIMPMLLMDIMDFITTNLFNVVKN